MGRPVGQPRTAILSGVPARPDGPPPPPAVQKLRLRYAKRGRLRFSSHRDFQRALERALRRCDIPMAYSAGFTPHPKISYAGAAPTGASSEAEYVEISVVQRCDPQAIRAALDEALPPGLDIVEVIEAPAGALADRLQASHWQLELPGVDDERLSSALATFLARDEVLVERVTKSGRRELNARGNVLKAWVGDEQPVPGGNSGRHPCAILHLVVRHTTPSVRPDDILTALRSVDDFAPAAPALMTRLAQGPLNEESCEVADPFGLPVMTSTSTDDAS